MWLLLYLLLLSSLHTATAVTTETVVGVAGRRVVLPCGLDVEPGGGAEVCWGRGQPSLFNCHNAVINVKGERVTYRRSYRFSASASFSLSILSSRPSDSGFYHCRVQVPGLFNDRTSSVHLIVITAHAGDSGETQDLNSPELGTRTDGTRETGSPQSLTSPHSSGATTEEQTADPGSGLTNTTEPVVALFQSPVQQVNSLWTTVGNTLRLSFIVFIPALLLSSLDRLCGRGRSQSEEEEEEVEQQRRRTSV